MNVSRLAAILVVTISFCLQPVSAQVAAPAAAVQQELTPAQQENRKKAIEALTRELAEMIPGGVEFTPERTAGVNKFMEAFISGEGEKAIELIKAQSESDSTFPPSELVVASLQFSSNNAAAAKQTLEAAALKNPDYPGVFLAFSRLAINENRNSDGLAHLEKAKRLIDSGQWSAEETEHFRLRHLDGLADVYMRFGKWDDAMPFLDELAKVTPDDPKLLVRQAEVMYRKENVDQSLQLLNRFASSMTSSGQKVSRRPELMLATWFNRDGNEQQAQKWIVLANEKYPDDIEVMAEYADWMVGRERYADAQIAIKKIVENNGDTVATKFIKGKIAFAQESYGLAEAHFSELSLQEPANFELANLWALSLTESNSVEKKQRALQLAQRNVQVQPKNGVAMGILGWAYYRLGDINQAQLWLTRANQTQVNSSELAYFVSAVLEKQGQVEQAKNLLEKALQRKGVFLYRSSAKKLLKKINEATAGQLPGPDGK